MNKLHDSVDFIKLMFKYLSPTKDVSFYEYLDFKELFNAIKISQIKFSDAQIKQNQFLNKLSDIKIDKKTSKFFTILEKKLLVF